MKYGYVFTIEDTPKNNIWKSNREITLNDGSIVYGIKGNIAIKSNIGQVFTPENFKIWLNENTPEIID